MLQTEKTWVRYHGQFGAFVKCYGDENYTAVGLRLGSNRTSQTIIPTLTAAQAEADDQVQELWPHSCQVERCKAWSD